MKVRCPSVVLITAELASEALDFACSISHVSVYPYSINAQSKFAAALPQLRPSSKILSDVPRSFGVRSDQLPIV